MQQTSHYGFNLPESSDLFNVEHFNENASKIDNKMYSIETSTSLFESHVTNTSNPHQVTKSQVGLGNVDNTSDLNKPISNATQTELNRKANASDLGTAAFKNVPTSGDASTNQVVLGNDSRLTDSRTPTSHTHTTSQITDLPTIPTKTSDLTNDSGFINYKAVSTVAGQVLSETEKANARTNIGAGASSFSGDYNDLTNKPTSLSNFTNDCNFVAQYYQTTEPNPRAIGAVWIG